MGGWDKEDSKVLDTPKLAVYSGWTDHMCFFLTLYISNLLHALVFSC